MHKEKAMSFAGLFAWKVWLAVLTAAPTLLLAMEAFAQRRP
jgi:hypothetical protein